jgi:Sec-independent protein secretion pathway component TatC
LLFFLPSPFAFCCALLVKIGSEDISVGHGCRTYCEHVHKIYRCFGMGFQIPMCMSQVSFEI